MTTQYEREQMAKARKARHLLALVEAAHAALAEVEDPDVVADLSRALEQFSLDGLRQSVMYYDSQDARRQSELERVEAGRRALEELPEAPPRMQCEAEVLRSAGRMTTFGRCQKVAKLIVFDNKARHDRVACRAHALKYVTDGTTGLMEGWSTEPTTLPWWFRVNRWCMTRDESGRRWCSVRVEQATGLHPGKEHKFR